MALEHLSCPRIGNRTANRAQVDDIKSGGVDDATRETLAKVDLEDVAVEHLSGLVLAPVVQHHSVLQRERVCVSVCVCLRERKREREREWVSE